MVAPRARLRERARPEPGVREARGDLGAALDGALLGDVLGTILTGATVIHTADFCLDECEERGHDPVGLWLATYSVRPILVGGLTGAVGRASGGRGQTGYAMLASLPGSALLAVGLATEYRGGFATYLVLGHAALLGGAIFAYRRTLRPREDTGALARLVPSFFGDRGSGALGLVLSGTF